MNGSNRSTVTEAVIKLVTENPMVKIDHIEAPMLLAELNVDSLEKLSIAMDLEDAFDWRLLIKRLKTLSLFPTLLAVSIRRWLQGCKALAVKLKRT